MSLHRRLLTTPAALARKLVPEGPRLRIRRLLYTYYPAYFGTGAKIESIAPDFSEVRIRLPLSWRTKNTHGTIFGGSIYGAVDPIQAMMLAERLGDGYQAWVKSGEVEFKKPARSALYGTFRLEDEELRAVERALEEQSAVERSYTADLVDEDGTTHATVKTTVHVTHTD